jgi:hypothetical protein
LVLVDGDDVLGKKGVGDEGDEDTSEAHLNEITAV